MRLIAGLGNPGPKYANNRHNVGFMVVDGIARAHRFSPWRDKFQGETADGSIGGEKVILLKPATFMNESGRSVGAALRFYKLTPADLIVIHDEIDLAPGKLRIKEGGGHAGHNGLRSIHQHLGDAYVRLRIGVGHPGRKEAVAGYVLNDFSRADADWLEPMLDRIATAAGRLVAGDYPRFLTDVAANTRPKPDGPMDPPLAGGAASRVPEAQAAPRSKLAELLGRLSGRKEEP